MCLILPIKHNIFLFKYIFIFLLFELYFFTKTSIQIALNKYGEPHALRLLSFILQYTTATAVLTNVATIAGAMIPAGFTLPYCCL